MAIFRGPLIVNVNIDAERSSRLIRVDLADLIAFGRPYIANPDLVERLKIGAPLAEIEFDDRLCLGAARLFRLPGAPVCDRLIPTKIKET